MKKQYSLYSVCQCNHEYLQHNDKCSALIPIGRKFYRGGVPQGILSESCDCLKFKFSAKNTANPKPTEAF